MGVVQEKGTSGTMTTTAAAGTRAEASVSGGGGVVGQGGQQQQQDGDDVMDIRMQVLQHVDLDNSTTNNDEEEAHEEDIEAVIGKDGKDEVTTTKTQADEDMGRLIAIGAAKNAAAAAATTTEVVDSVKGVKEEDPLPTPQRGGRLPGAFEETNEENAKISEKNETSGGGAPESSRTDDGNGRVAATASAAATGSNRQRGGRGRRGGRDTVTTDEGGDIEAVAPTAEIVDMNDIETQFMNRIIANATTATEVQVIDEGNNNGNGDKMDDTNQSGGRGKSGLLSKGLITCIVIFVVLIIFVILRVSSGADADDKDNTNQLIDDGDDSIDAGGIESNATIAPTTKVILNDYEYLLNILSPDISDLDKLLDNTTSQYRAMNWLLEDDPAVYDIQQIDKRSLIERYIISHLYFSTSLAHLKGGQDWRNKLNFLSSYSICDWNSDATSLTESNVGGGGNSGIYCYDEVDGTQYVSTVHLNRNDLIGTLPSEIFSLSLLKHLNVYSEKGLTGTIPKELFQKKLPFLQFVRLSGTSIGGTFPEWTYTDNNLINLNLQHNNITGTIDFDNIFNNYHSSMEILAIAGNNYLAGTLPTSIGLMTKLTNIAFG